MSKGAIRKQTLQPSLAADSSLHQLSLNASDSALDLTPKPKLVSIPENLDFRLLSKAQMKVDGNEAGSSQTSSEISEVSEVLDDVDKSCSVLFVGSICSIKTYKEIKGVGIKLAQE